MNEITCKSRFAKEEEAADKLLADLRTTIMSGETLSPLAHAFLGCFLRESLYEVTDMADETIENLIEAEEATIDDNFERALRTTLEMASVDSYLMKQKG